MSRHHDVTELMLLADVLVTDYSSVMFDFANTGKPMVFYTYDYEDYVRDERGTYLDLPEVAPGPIVVATTDELIAALRVGGRRRRAVPRQVRRVPRAVLQLRDRARGRARRRGVLRRPGADVTAAEQPGTSSWWPTTSRSSAASSG